MIPVRMSESQFETVIAELLSGFAQQDGTMGLLPGKGFDGNDDLFRSGLSYHALHTCNTWMNGIFKKAGLKACLWTPFSWRLIDLYGGEDAALSTEGKWRD